jgi:tetratricopeptide (TPR) repeat protein
MKMKSLFLAMLAISTVPALHAQTTQMILTPAQQKISWAHAAMQENPSRSQPYNELAAAYVSRVRETADSSYYVQAEEALQKSRNLSPDNFEAQRVQVSVLLGRMEFAKALALATSLNKKMPDDVMTYGLVADADLGLGRYNEAETAAQWMLDLRPGNVSGLLLGARLRRIFGDMEGAMDFYSQAYRQMPPTETENLAWILTQMADLDLFTGNIPAADKLLQSALNKFPGYYLALECQARVRGELEKVRPAPADSRRPE